MSHSTLLSLGLLSCLVLSCTGADPEGSGPDSFQGDWAGAAGWEDEGASGESGEVGASAGQGGNAGVGGQEQGGAAGAEQGGAGGADPCEGETATLVQASPKNKKKVDATDVRLSVTLEDDDINSYEVTFYLTRITAADDFTIVVLPDTQNYAQFPGNNSYFRDQTQWIWKERNDRRIVAVIHNGDMTQHGNGREAEWKVGDGAMSELEKSTSSYPDGIPWGMAIGNHDNDQGKWGKTALYNEYFGINRFKNRDYYGGHFEANKNDENWFRFVVGKLPFVVLSFQYGVGAHPNALNWGREVFDNHPRAFGIINAHSILTAKGDFSAEGKAIYKSVKDAANVHLMTCGHIHEERRRSDTDAASKHKIHSMLADYQDRPHGGNGLLRVWRFLAKEDQLRVRTFSPSLGTWETDGNSEFTLSVPLTGVGSNFEPVASKVASSLTIKTLLDDLQTDSVYEWYADVTSCGHSFKTPVYRFLTKP